MSRAKTFVVAYKKGLAAAHRGDGLETCPYPDRRTPSGFITWSTAYRTMWFDGWRDGTLHQLTQKNKEIES